MRPDALQPTLNSPAPTAVLADTPEHRQQVEQRWVGLLGRVDAKVQTLNGADRKIEARLIEQASRAGSVGKRVMWLRKAADAVNAFAAPIAACKPGCSHCCRIAVTISRAEAMVISRETGARMNPHAGSIRAGDVESPAMLSEVADWAFGKPCTFLRGGDCSIYVSRPLVCRLLVNLDEDDLLCRLVENNDPQVPYLNTMQHQAMSVGILGTHQDYDDIRRWFPGGTT